MTRTNLRAASRFHTPAWLTGLLLCIASPAFPGVTAAFTSPAPGTPLRAGDAINFRVEYQSNGTPVRLGATEISANGQDWLGKFNLRPTEGVYRVRPSDSVVAGPLNLTATVRDQEGNAATVSASYEVSPRLSAATPTARLLDFISMGGVGLDPIAANNEAVFSTAIEGQAVTAPFDSIDADRRLGKVQVPVGATTGPVMLRVNGVDSAEALDFTLKVDPVVTDILFTAPLLAQPLEINGGSTMVLSYNVGGLAPNLSTLSVAANGVDWTPRFTAAPLAATHLLLNDSGLVGGKTLLLTASIRSDGDVEGRTHAVYWLIPKFKAITPKAKTGSLITIEAEGLDPIPENNVLIMTAPFMPEGVMVVPLTGVSFDTAGVGTVNVPQGVTSGPVRLEVNGAKALLSLDFELIPPFPNCGKQQDYSSGAFRGPLQVTFLADGGSVVYYRRDEPGSAPADIDPACPSFPAINPPASKAQDLIIQFSPLKPPRVLLTSEPFLPNGLGPFPLGVVPDRAQENVAIVSGGQDPACFGSPNWYLCQNDHEVFYGTGGAVRRPLALSLFPGNIATADTRRDFAQEAAFIGDKLMFWEWLVSPAREVEGAQLVSVDPLSGTKTPIGGPVADSPGTVAGSCDGLLYAGARVEEGGAGSMNSRIFKVDPETGLRTALSLVQQGVEILSLTSTCGQDLLVLTRIGEFPNEKVGLASVNTATGVWVDKLVAPWSWGTLPRLVLDRSGGLAIWNQINWMPLPPDLSIPQCAPCPTTGGICGGALPRCPGRRRIIERGQEPGEQSEAAEEKPATDEVEKVKPKEPCPVGRPVNPATGAMFVSHTDVAVAGRNRSISVTRSYNSRSAFAGLSGPFGRGWEFGLGKYIVTVGNLRRLSTGTRSPIYFEDADADGTWTAYAPRTETSRLVSQSGGGYARTFAEGGSENYDPAGRMVAQTDNHGNLTTFSYSGSEVVAITAPGGRTLSLSWAAGHVATVSTAAGLQATYTYSGDLLATVTYADGRGLAFSYDDYGRGLLTEVKDHTGLTIEKHDYDFDGWALTSEGPGGSEKFTFAYDLAGGATTVTDATGAVATYRFQTVAGVQKTVRIDGPCACTGNGEFTAWQYDPATGRVLSVLTSAADQPTVYEYNSAGDVARIIDPLGRVVQFTYDAEGRLISQTLPDTSVWQRTTSATQHTATDPLNRTSSVHLNASGQPESVTDARGKTATIVHTAEGDVASVGDPLNHATTFTYDASGRLLSTTDAMNRTTTLTRDSRGRVWKVEKPDGKTTEFTFDSSGRRATVKDERGRVSRTTYDAASRVAAVTDTTGQVTRYEYDIMGRLTALTDAKGQSTRFEYDVAGRLTTTRQPDGKETVLGYDSRGRLIQRADQAGRLITYAYDEISRLTSVQMTGIPAVTYSYDVMDRIETMANGTDTLGWTYNLAGEVVSEASAKNQSTVSYSYNANGSRTGLGLDGTLFASYAYDDASRLTSITRGSNVFGFGYDAVNRRTSLSHPNGINTTYSYDTLSRLTGIQAVKDLATISTFTYGYDDVGNRTSKNVGDHLENYGYDDLDRLTSVSRTGVGENTWRFGYDAVGNRTSTQVGSGEVVSPTFNNRNQLQQQAVGGALVVEGTLDEEATVSVNGAPARMVTPTHFEATIQSNPGTNAFTVAATDLSGNVRTDDYEVAVSGTAASYGYDAAGNLISKTLPGETWTYTWNALNQLTSASRNGALQASFQYDPLGRRVVKSTPAKVTTYTYDGADILREHVTAGGITTTSYYVHGPSIDEPLGKETGGVMTYYHADGLGSIVKETSALGAVTNTLRYDAWGNIEAGARDGFAFTGREWDPETGLYYYRARYYDPRAGRFISEDPIGFGGGDVNLYGYVGGDPVNWVDPFGLQQLITNMTKGTTTFDPGYGAPFWMKPLTIQTRNAVDSRSKPGAAGPYSTGDVTPRHIGDTPEYGPDGAYIDTQDRPRGRVIHGGGSSLPDPLKPRQGWRPTFGCTRGQNEDVIALAELIRQFQQAMPGVAIPYIRFNESQPYIPGLTPPWKPQPSGPLQPWSPLP